MWNRLLSHSDVDKGRIHHDKRCALGEKSICCETHARSGGINQLEASGSVSRDEGVVCVTIMPTWKEKGAPGCSKCRHSGCKQCYNASQSGKAYPTTKNKTPVKAKSPRKKKTTSRKSPGVVASTPTRKDPATSPKTRKLAREDGKESSQAKMKISRSKKAISPLRTPRTPSKTSGTGASPPKQLQGKKKST